MEVNYSAVRCKRQAALCSLPPSPEPPESGSEKDTKMHGYVIFYFPGTCLIILNDKISHLCRVLTRSSFQKPGY